MSDSGERDQLGERLREQAAELESLTTELLRSVSHMAGKIAETEDEVARVHEDLAGSPVNPMDAHEVLEHAERARRFAEHERQEQRRWSSRAEGD